jgi:hypothetical protein
LHTNFPNLRAGRRELTRTGTGEQSSFSSDVRIAIGIWTVTVITLLVVAELVASAGMESHPYKKPQLFPADRQVDALGAESNIHSIQDVDTYINALIQNYKKELSERFGVIDADLYRFGPIESRIAAAEYAAIGDHSKRIPEKFVVSAFNGLMDEWNTPSWARISLRELHAYREQLALTRYPASVARDDEGNLSDSCRPVEAVLLLYRLERSGGVSPGLRHLVESGNFNYAVGQQVSAGPPNTRLVPGSHAGDDVIRNAAANRAAALERAREYVSARDAFFLARPNIDPVDYVEHVLGLLQIS